MDERTEKLSENWPKLIPDVIKITTSLIRETFRNYPRVSFAQIGVNDGYKDDFLHALIQEDDRFYGLLVEPVEYILNKLKKYYSDSGRFTYSNAVVSYGEKKRRFYYISENYKQVRPDLPDYLGRIGSLSRKHFMRLVGPGNTKLLCEKEVETTSLNKLLNSHAIEKLDLLVIDAEGEDHRILSAFDFKKYKPKMIIYEHTHIHGDWIRLMESKLKIRGYSVQKIGPDTIGILC